MTDGIHRRRTKQGRAHQRSAGAVKVLRLKITEAVNVQAHQQNDGEWLVDVWHAVNQNPQVEKNEEFDLREIVEAVEAVENWEKPNERIG